MCDLNCDMGEGIGNDELIMPYITSANIACGYHAGDENTIQQTIKLAKKYKVNIGAHPSFLDRENFGRTDMKLSPQEVYELALEQIKIIQKIANHNNVPLHHVKPHGALYNIAAKDKKLAKAIADAVNDIDDNLILYGLSNSFLISEAKAIGLKTKSEVFADRTYQDDRTLTPRTQPNALIENVDEAIQQVLMMVQKGKVKTVSGK
ncbi:MAG TPA: 5-oxoprolinase subunit PxpA, partial [Chitinophagaceae bacterium]|nr:5-oxoprolinase subunit PxpA [Chitinophagaceae bacterium]